jgi:hypothetical protein
MLIAFFEVRRANRKERRYADVSFPWQRTSPRPPREVFERKQRRTKRGSSRLPLIEKESG